ncbi:hypothetical protein F4859DRAFT_459932 [Xylaria cf. heliscus]|nr:hypothetical protein F4859DRAFT_459932 [Xylaria cf. heliscus]
MTIEATRVVVVVVAAAAAAAGAVRLPGVSAVIVAAKVKQAIIMVARVTAMAHLLPGPLLGTNPTTAAPSQATAAILATLVMAVQLQEWDRRPVFPQTLLEHLLDCLAI